MSLNHLEPPGPVHAYTPIALTLPLPLPSLFIYYAVTVFYK